MFWGKRRAGVQMVADEVFCWLPGAVETDRTDEEASGYFSSKPGMMSRLMTLSRVMTRFDGASACVRLPLGSTPLGINFGCSSAG
jgi:hypothetical protein